MRLIARLAAVFGLAATLIAVPVTAHAAATDCKTVTSTLKDRPDSGNHGTWATDQVTRTVKVCHVVEGAKTAVVIETWKYHATVTDTGTFITLAGLSPNKGHAVKGGVKGWTKGSFTADFTAPHDWIGWDDSLDGKTLTGAANPSTSLWVKALWKDGFGGTSINDDWSWLYWTCDQVPEKCTEKWLDNAKTQGNGPKDGDIVGKPCASPSPSPTPSHSPHASPTAGGTGAGTPSLPVTGPSMPLLVGFGLALAATGTVLVLALRRRRIRFTA